MASQVVIYADLSLDVKKNINASSAVRWASALAQRGVHMQMLVGHGPRVFISPEEAAQIYHATVVGGHSFLMFATKELQLPTDLLEYPFPTVFSRESACLSNSTPTEF